MPDPTMTFHGSTFLVMAGCAIGAFLFAKPVCRAILWTIRIRESLERLLARGIRGGAVE